MVASYSRAGSKLNKVRDGSLSAWIVCFKAKLKKTSQARTKFHRSLLPKVAQISPVPPNPQEQTCTSVLFLFAYNKKIKQRSRLGGGLMVFEHSPGSPGTQISLSIFIVQLTIC